MLTNGRLKNGKGRGAAQRGCSHHLNAALAPERSRPLTAPHPILIVSILVALSACGGKEDEAKAAAHKAPATSSYTLTPEQTEAQLKAAADAAAAAAAEGGMGVPGAEAE